MGEGAEGDEEGDVACRLGIKQLVRREMRRKVRRGLRTSMYIEGTCKLQKNKNVSSQSEPAHCTTEDPLEHNDEMALRAHRVRALAVHGEVVVPPKDFGPIVRRASEALYARQRAARRLRREQRGRVGRAVQGFPDDAAHGAAAL